MFKKDKILHFLCCLVPSLTGWYGLAFVLGAAIAKEWDDNRERGNTWSWSDIAADVIGMIAGIGIYLLIFPS
jgi:uncharacterized protein YfiM (DUF2279 family)